MATNSGCTIVAYTDYTRISVEELRRYHLRNGRWSGSSALEMDYLDEHGMLVSRRCRIALKGDRFRWRKNDRPVLYGLWRLAQIRTHGYIVLVEGESDCHVLWHHGVPAVGVPGAGTWRNDWAAYFDGIEIIYAVIEPDSGGETLLTKLGASPLRDRIRVIRLVGHEDPLDLHRADPESFPEVWRAAMAAAALLSDLVSASEASNTIACHLDRVGSIAEDASEDEVIEWLRRLFDGVRDPVVRAGLRQAAINQLKHVDRNVSTTTRRFRVTISRRTSWSRWAFPVVERLRSWRSYQWRRICWPAGGDQREDLCGLERY